MSSSEYDASDLDLTDPLAVQRVLSAEPFHAIPGVLNFRDFGFLAPRSISFTSNSTGTLSAGSEAKRTIIKPRVLFRSADLSKLTPAGAIALADVGVRIVFDLRAASEVRAYASATPAAAESADMLKFVRAPVSDGADFDPTALGAKLALFEKNEKAAFAALYTSILENGGPSFELILTHLRDKPEEGCLIHCTYGKDRTGIFAALIQLLLGATDEQVAHDYALTEIGLQPAFEYLLGRLRKEQAFRDNWTGALNMASSRKENMIVALGVLQERYGDVEKYVKEKTSLTDVDIARIRENLLIS